MLGGFGGGMGGPKGMLEKAGADIEKTTFNPQVIRRLLAYLRPHLGTIVLASFCMLAFSGLSLLAPWLVKDAIDNHIAHGELPLLSAVLLFAAYIAMFGFSVGQRFLLSRAGTAVLTTLRSTLFEHLQRLHLGYHDTHIIGVTVSRVINDVGIINELLTQGLVVILGDFFLLIGIVVVMLSISPALALYSFSVVPVLILATLLFSRRAKHAYRRTRSTVASVVGELAENISGIKVIQAYAQEGAAAARFDQHNDQNRKAHVSAMSLSYIFIPAVEFIGVAASGVVLLAGGFQVLQGGLSIGAVVAFLSYTAMFFQPVRELSQMFTTMQSAMAGGEQVFKLLDTAPAVTDPDQPRELATPAGHIRLENVHFSYIPGRPVLGGVTIDVPPGKSIALVGPTGAGKSSIANLVCRFYDPDSGQVLLDGVDIRAYRQTDLRRHMAVVSQDPILFTGTIRQNLTFARPAATEAELREALERANLLGFVDALPQGMDTPLQEGGSNLSSGQRQLLSIARAVLAQPRILILDEATASIDTVTETLIQDALKTLMKGRSSLVIAHRLSTIREADRIYVIDGGRIAEEGSHQDLIAQAGIYAQLYRRQFVKIERSADI